MSEAVQADNIERAYDAPERGLILGEAMGAGQGSSKMELLRSGKKPPASKEAGYSTGGDMSVVARLFRGGGFRNVQD
jgi:hypothetical protein